MLGNARILREQPFDLGPGDRQAAHIGPRPHSGSSFDVLAEQGALAEDVARPELAFAFPRFDDCLPLLEHEHAGARPAAFGQRLTGRRLDLRRRGSEPIELSVVEISEQRERAQAVPHRSPSPGRPSPPSAPPARPPSLDSIRFCAARIASFTAAMIMSSSISGSFGSIAFGSILISLISPAPFATTVTIPPPAVASTVSFASSA